MAKYRKKPVVIDAEPYREGLEDGWKVYYEDEWGFKEELFKSKSAAEKYIEQAPDRYSTDEVEDVIFETPVPVIKTLEGFHDITPTDMIITGIKGERYPCKKDIFDLTYEPIITMQ